MSKPQLKNLPWTTKRDDTLQKELCSPLFDYNNNTSFHFSARSEHLNLGAVLIVIFQTDVAVLCIVAKDNSIPK